MPSKADRKQKLIEAVLKKKNAKKMIPRNKRAKAHVVFSKAARKLR